MSAAVGNSAVTEDALVAGQFYTIKRRGQFVASGEFTGRYAQGGALGTSPIFQIGDSEQAYPRGRYSYYKEVNGGSRRRSTRSSTRRRRSTRRHRK